MNIKEQIIDYLEDLLEDSAYFLVDVDLKGTERFPKLFIYIDGDDGISIGKCTEISRGIYQFIEEEEIITTEYGIDVSSPGIDRPISFDRQYKKNIGKKLRITTSEPKPFEGMLISNDAKEVVLEVVKGKEKVLETILKSNIVESKVLVTF